LKPWASESYSPAPLGPFHRCAQHVLAPDRTSLAPDNPAATSSSGWTLAALYSYFVLVVEMGGRTGMSSLLRSLTTPPPEAKVHLIETLAPSIESEKEHPPLLCPMNWSAKRIGSAFVYWPRFLSQSPYRSAGTRCQKPVCVQIAHLHQKSLNVRELSAPPPSGPAMCIDSF
jgi:hypothetical protein